MGELPLRPNRSRLLAAVFAAALVASACGGSGTDDAADAATDAGTDDPVTETEVENDPDDAAPDAEPDAGEAELPVIEPREIGETVRYAGFEFEVQSLAVDDEGVDDPATAVPLGLTFDLSVENTEPASATPAVPVALQWNDEGDDVVEISGMTEFREIPGESSSRGTVEFQVPPTDLETWDEDSARLVFGRSGDATALVPLGDDAGDLVTRMTVSQDLGDELDLGGFLVEIEGAVVRWDLPGSRQQVEQGTAILEVSARITNGTDGQQCLGSQGGRITPTITLVDGTSRTLLDTNVNCLSVDEVERDAKIAFDIDDPFAGDYTVTLEGGVGLDGSATLAFTLADDAGATDADTDADDGRIDDDDDDDEDEDEGEDDDDEDED